MREVAMTRSPNPTKGIESTVRELMFEPVIVVERPAHLAAAAYLMQNAHNPALVVVDNLASRRPVAIITARDFVRAVAHGVDANVEKVATWETPCPISVGPETPIGHAVDLMLEAGYPALPVVDDAGQLIGLIDLHHFARAVRDAQRAGVA
jgi:CBS domain-containing protein